MRREVVLILVLSAVTSARAGMTYEMDMEYATGQGANEAAIVVDFDGFDYFVFAYRWDGETTGWDALEAIDLAGSLDVEATWYEQFQCHFVEDFIYGDAEKYLYGGGVITGWGYWQSDNNEDWVTGGGVDFRILSDGAFDAWVWSNYDFEVSWDPIRSPGEMPIPEPGTILLMMKGTFLFGRIRRIAR